MDNGWWIIDGGWWIKEPVSLKVQTGWQALLCAALTGRGAGYQYKCAHIHTNVGRSGVHRHTNIRAYKPLSYKQAGNHCTAYKHTNQRADTHTTHIQTYIEPLYCICIYICIYFVTLLSRRLLPSFHCTMCGLGSMIPLYELFPRTIYRGIKNSTVHIQGNIRFPCICTGEFSIPLYNYRGTISLYVFLLRVVQCRVLAWILETFDHTGLEE